MVLERLREHPVSWLIVAFALTIPLVTPYLRGDGMGYYAWLRSPIIDGDLDFANEFERGNPAFVDSTHTETGEIRPALRTGTGLVRNQWAVGAAILWSPFFVLGHLSAAVGGQATDGFSLPYRWWTGFGTALYAFGALLISALLVRRRTRSWAAVSAALVVWGASSLLVYQYFLPFWPFGAGAFVGAALLAVWWRPSWSWRRWGAMGVLSGLALIVHPVGVAWAAGPAASLLGLEQGAVRERARGASAFLAGLGLGVLPQLALKAVVHGSSFDTGYRVDLSLSELDFVRMLFGADHGLISWTPIAGVALVGLVLLAVRDRRLGLGLLAVFGTMLSILAVYATYEQSSYGNRFFVLFTAGFVVGVAVLVDALWERRRHLVITAGALLVTWNLLFAFQWAWGMIPKRGPVEWDEVVANQVTEAPRELVRAAGLFWTDRGELIRRVQQTDRRRRESR